MNSIREKDESAIVWTERDYRSGVIEMYQSRVQHIKDHDHAVMLRPENMEAVKLTIRDPDEVYRDRDRDLRQSFYRVVESASFYNDGFRVKTVIQYKDPTLMDGIVITTYPVEEVKERDVDRIFPPDQ